MALAIPSLEPCPTARVETRWRRIVTPIPVPESLSIIERLRRVEPRSMAGMPPVLWKEAEGFLVRDGFGNQWIDLTSGIVVANAGHSHPKIREAIVRAVNQKLLFSYAFAQSDRLALLEWLVSLSPIPGSKALLFSAGTEANECAIMLMRRHGKSISDRKTGILSFANGYHGRTLAAGLASGQPSPGDWITREEARHYQIPFPFTAIDPQSWSFARCLQSLQQRGIGADAIAGIIVEPVPGWTTWPMPPEFGNAMADWARQNDILICFDEVQCGCGRTGRFFGCEHVGVTPDLITLGKGLSSSLPCSAVLGRREILDVPLPGEMSSTHSGNPVCAAAALANLLVIDEEQLVRKADTTGARVLERLRALQSDYPTHFDSIHGPGLFISVQFRNPSTGQPDVELADAIIHEAVRRGVMLFTTGRGYLKFTPPLCIDPEAALEAADVIRESFEVCRDQRQTRTATPPARRAESLR